MLKKNELDQGCLKFYITENKNGWEPVIFKMTNKTFEDARNKTN